MGERRKRRWRGQHCSTSKKKKTSQNPIHFSGLQNHPQFLLHFLIHIDVLMICRKFEPIPSSNF